MLSSRKWPQCRVHIEMRAPPSEDIRMTVIKGFSLSRSLLFHRFRASSFYRMCLSGAHGKFELELEWICPLQQPDMSSEELDIKMLFQHFCGPGHLECRRTCLTEYAEYLTKISEVSNFPALWLMFGQVLTEWMWLDVCWAHRQPDRQRTNDLWKKKYLMMPGYLASLTHSVSGLHSRSVFLSHFIICPSLTFSTLLLFHFFLILFHFFSLTRSQTLLSPSPHCHSVFYTIQVLAVEGDGLQHDSSMRGKNKLIW